MDKLTSKMILPFECLSRPQGLFMILSIIDEELFKYLSIEDHVNLAVAFPDKYLHFLLGKVNYKFSTTVDYDSVIKMALESININNLKPYTLNLFHKGFWNHISLNCRLQEKFIYKWSHKINFFRLKVNKHCRNLGGQFGWELLPRQFSEKFKSRFPGIENYKPCKICFQDTDDHYNNFLVENEWVCEECMYNDSLFDYDDRDYEPLDRRHWSEDDTDYEDFY